MWRRYGHPNRNWDGYQDNRDRMLGRYHLVHYREIAIVLNIKLNEIIYQGPSTVLGT